MDQQYLTIHTTNLNYIVIYYKTLTWIYQAFNTTPSFAGIQYVGLCIQLAISIETQSIYIFINTIEVINHTFAWS